MAVAAAIGALGGWLGLVISYDASVHHGWRLASGGTIVLALTGLFALALAGAGLRSLRSRRQVGRGDDAHPIDETTPRPAAAS